ncbi:glycerophosphodiester phosphodiesterase [Blastopirellula marina]|uniref:Glycerophosphodiester phosphodiesterase n=1 Tax=Blastopirellula marina TaxID=124 RepID=A0A2S8F7Q3_9BACT|nr:glycerophosphodiester phosphodiesterase [Blastopirellula marina]PQO28191.1 glycerophosphodiester phosphodiesterase [Blastopirellula marina]PTL41731.1 glycerophosphodiester phosphodiesterase [Blastopirellula marina]
MRIGIGLLLAALTAFGCFPSTGQAQMIVAHRGASFVAPENTLASFHEAWKQGADVIEGDFYLTKDGQIACIHDKTTERTSGGSAKLKIADSTLEELRSVDVGTWKAAKYAGQHIPTLEEVLATIPESGKIFIEVKCGTEIIEPLQAAIKKSNLEDEQIIIICFDKEVVRQCREKMPQYKASWLTSYKEDKTTGKWKPSLESVVATLKQTGATGLGTQANDTVVTPDFVKAIREAGVECHVWTVNDPKQAQRYAGLGFDSITTDKPAETREAVASGK